MTTELPATAIDLAGLPGPVAESIKRLVDSLRANVTGDTQSEHPRSVIGLFADQGVPAPSLDELQAARRELYDDSEWTPNETARLAGAAFSQLDDDDYGEYVEGSRASVLPPRRGDRE